MQRSVYFQGELADKFGSKFNVSADSYSDIFKCIDANRPNFLPFVRECHRNDIGFIIETAGSSIEEQELLLPIKTGDITVSLAPAGSKSGIGKILAAIVLVVIIIYAPQIFGQVAGASGTATGATSFAAGLNIYGQIAVAFTANLAITGIQQLMAPDPAVDQDSPTNYLFSGGANNSVEGDPIPLLYGELRVPGRTISVDIMNGTGVTNNVSVDYNNNINNTGKQETQQK